jgi:hypothetical protein
MLVLSVDIAAMSLFMDKEMGMHEERPMAVASLLTGLSLRRRTWGADMAIIYTLLGDIVDGVDTSKADMGKKCHGQWKKIWYRRVQQGWVITSYHGCGARIAITICGYKYI